MSFVIQRSQEQDEPKTEQEKQVFEVTRAPEQKPGFGADIAKEYEALYELAKSGGKGFLEGVQRLGRVIGPLQDFKPEEERQKEFTERLEQFAPASEEEGFLQKGLRRGLREFPTVASFPGGGLGMLPRSILSGFLGEGSKELGAPEWAQTAAELTAYLGPDITKKILEKGSNKEIIQSARQFGLSDEQITPLIQSQFKKKWLSKLAPKRGRTQSVLQQTRKGLGDVYDRLKQSPEAYKSISREAEDKLLTKFNEISDDIPSSVREKVSKDIEDLLKKPITGESLMNLHRDINKATGAKTKELVRFKQPISEALTEISPKLGKDFSNINNLYSRYSEIASKLKPTLVSDLVNAAEVIGLFGTAILGDVPTMSKILAEQGIKFGARELLVNPRINQLGEKFLMALNQNKWALASKISSQFDKELKKLDDSIEVKSLSEEDLKKVFSH